MYKIYINESQLILCKDKDVAKANKNKSADLLVKYRSNKKYLLNYIDMLEKTAKKKLVIIHSDNFSKLKADFKSLFIHLPAAGGLVLTPKDEILFIFRRGYWDLPKGKMEKGETKKETAIREVMEETGIKDVKMIKKLGVTKHVFRTQSNKRAIKKSYWYVMESKNQKLTPQRGEDIEIAKWMTLEEFFKKKRPVYRSIVKILKKWKSKPLRQKQHS